MFFGGDFRQIPPILKHVSREEVVYSYLNRFYLWHHVKVVKVTIKMFRQIWSFHEVSDVNELSNILLRVIEGTKPENENQMINIDTKNIIRADSIAGLVTSWKLWVHEYYSRKIILWPKNETANLINNHVIHLLQGEGTTLVSADSVECIATVNFHRVSKFQQS